MLATTPQAALAIKNILIATDFSTCSDRALLHALAAANRFGATLHLLHVVPPHTYYIAPPDGYMGGPEIQIQCMALAERDANTQLERTLKSADCETLRHHTWVESGSVTDHLMAIVSREHIDMVIVGTHGRSGFRKLALGSVAEQIFRAAPCPVLTVGPNSWSSAPGRLRIRRVLFPTDLSADSARALPFAIAGITEFGSTLTMLNVLEHMDTSADKYAERVATAQREMHAMIAEVGGFPAAVDYKVECGEVPDTIIDTAYRLGVDLIVFGLKPPQCPADRLRWIHAYKIVSEVGCPVLSLRAPERSAVRP